MSKFKAVGAPVPREEGPHKVTGQAVYTADVKLPGMLWGKILRSPHPHARIRRIDTAKASQVTGVRAIVTGQDIPGRLMGKLIRDMPVLFVLAHSPTERSRRASTKRTGISL